MTSPARRKTRRGRAQGVRQRPEVKRPPGRRRERAVAVSAKDDIRAFINEVVSMAATKGVPLFDLQGIAFYNLKRDAMFTPLETYDGAIKAVISITGFVDKFGAGEGSRIVLQFVYQYFARVDSVRYDETAFHSLWQDLIAEVQESNWITRGIANVRYFKSENLVIDLGDGITIRGRNPEDLKSLGFTTAILDRIFDDWGEFGSSSFVLVVEHSTPKQSHNLILLDSYPLTVKVVRAIQALRLAAEGALSIGPIWVVRVARFNVGIGGLTRVGASIPTIGRTEYIWTAVVDQAYQPIYHALAQLDQNKWYNRSPGNLEIAIRAFMTTYDSWPSSPDWQLLNCITTLEALLGIESELSFRLSFRVANLLAANDTKRVDLFRSLREFYDTRSTLVHGAPLKDKHRQRLEKIDDLLAIVRRLLRAFVTFAATPAPGYKSLFKQLDAELLDAAKREKLRAVLQLNS